MGFPDNVILSFYTLVRQCYWLPIIWTIVTTKEYSPVKLKELGVTNDEEQKAVHESRFYADIQRFCFAMPKTMKQLGLVQFFSWLALFGMWVFTTPAIAEHIYGNTRSSIGAYNDAANWVGILFGIYNGCSSIVCIGICPGSRKIQPQKCPCRISYNWGSSLLSIFFIKDPMLLIIPMIGIGMAWASILSMPYAFLQAQFLQQNWEYTWDFSTSL